MKKLTFLPVILIALALFSCKKDDEQKDGYLNATVNGEEYKSIKVDLFQPPHSNGGIVSFSSTGKTGKEESKSISFAINNYKGAGTYYFKPDEYGKKNIATYIYYKYGTQFDKNYTTRGDEDDDGYIIITKVKEGAKQNSVFVGTQIEGTIKFTAYMFNGESVTVTGSFSNFSK